MIVYLASTQCLSVITEIDESSGGSKGKVSFSREVGDDIQNEYIEIYNQVIAGELDFRSIAKALQEILNYQLSQDKTNDKKIKNLLKSTERFIKNPSELSETSDSAIYQRELFFSRLQKALERSSYIMETKYLLIKALSKELDQL
jgi:hypothetical protein